MTWKKKSAFLAVPKFPFQGKRKVLLTYEHKITHAVVSIGLYLLKSNILGQKKKNRPTLRKERIANRKKLQKNTFSSRGKDLLMFSAHLEPCVTKERQLFYPARIFFLSQPNQDARLKTLLPPAISGADFLSCFNLQGKLFPPNFLQLSYLLLHPHQIWQRNPEVPSGSAAVQNWTTTQHPHMIHLHQMCWVWQCQGFLVITAVL